MTGRDDVRRSLAELPQLDATALRARWRLLYGGSAPIHLSRDLLTRAIAYRIQEQAYGGLNPRTVRRLDRLIRDLDRGEDPSPTIPDLLPGTRLMREWKGETHVVEVVQDGFLWRGECYSSLSVIARRITGSRWSGPRFFGLKAMRQTREPR